MEIEVREMGGFPCPSACDAGTTDRSGSWPPGCSARALGRASVARALGIPEEAVRKWQLTYRAVGRDGLLSMGEKHSRCDFETKVAAASAVVDGGMGKPEAMGLFGIASATCIQSSKSRQFALSISHTSLGACPNP
jgi:hypothetical protein